MIVIIGSANMDLVASVPTCPAAGETTLATGYGVHYGGKGANQAVAAARLNADVRFIGAVGSDDFGQQLLANLANEHIDTGGVHRFEGSSGLAFITVETGGENRIVVVPGANGRLDKSTLPIEHLTGADVVLVQLETSPSFVAAALAYGRHVGAEVILNAAPAASLEPFDMRHVDWLMVNAGEAAYLLDAAESGDLETAHHHAQALADRYATGVVLTLGRHGALWIERDGSYGHTIAFEARVVDTTGAGDTFAGAFAVARMQGRSAGEAVRYAAAAGALSVSKAGAQTGMPSAAKVDKLLSKQPN